MVAELNGAGDEFLLMGGGSNILIADEGVDTTIVRFVSDEPLVERDGNTITVAGSSYLDPVVQRVGQWGLDGLNFCSGIPGTVGGAIVGNAGAWGRQVGDVLKSVSLLHVDGHVAEATPSELGFAYRHSHLKEDTRIVLSACFDLAPSSAAKLSNERAEIIERRAARHPDLAKEPCIGSFFRNIEPSSNAERRQAAGWFLEQVGAKAMRVGGARVFERHANIIVKDPNGTAADVHKLAAMMQAAVKQRFGFDLIREVRYLGEFPGAPPGGVTFW